MIWKIKNRSLDLSSEACLMGILNTTPDSFSDGGRFEKCGAALDHALQMISEGAMIIDIGGESTRPGAPPVDADDEMLRVLPVIEALRAQWDGFISVDTQKASVAKVALESGADIVNDVSGLMADPEMIEVCAASDCGLVVMHMQGNPESMQESPSYQNVVEEIRAFFAERLSTLSSSRISADRVCFDPGIGFGKSLTHNLEILRNIDRLAPSGSPLLLGISRKSFLSKITPATEPAERDAPTAAVTAIMRGKGIMLHRVHNVKANLAALRAAETFQK